MVTVVIGISADAPTLERVRNLKTSLGALRQQSLPRESYRIVIVEQGLEQKLDHATTLVADEYVFAYSPRPFNRSWVLNVGAMRAAPGVICTFDADLVVPSNFLLRGYLAWQCGALGIRPFQGILYMDVESTQRVHEQVLAGEPIDCDAAYHQGEFHPWSKGGCIWVDTRLYHEIGGHDERFEGWGDEDREFWDRLTQRTPVTRLDGRLLHLYHARDFAQQPGFRANRILWRALQNGVLAPPRTRVIGDVNRYRDQNGTDGHSVRQPLAAIDSTRGLERERLREAILEEAMRVCRGVEVWDGREPQRLRLRGLLAGRNGEDDAAEACLAGSLRLDSRQPDHLLDLGRILLRRGRVQEAVDAQLRAIAIAPANPAPYRELGRALVRSGRLMEARLVYREALELDLGNRQTFGELGELLLAQGYLNQALNICQALKWKGVDDYLRLGRVRLARREWETAFEAFREGLALVESPTATSGPPEAPNATPVADDLWSFRSDSYWLDDPHSPNEQLRRGDHALVDPRCVAFHVGIGEALFRLGAVDKAAAALIAALTLAPTDLHAARCLVLLFEAVGRRDEAVGAWISLGGALEARQRFDEAVVAYRQAIAHKPNCLRALIKLGCVQATRGELTAAIQSFEQALAIDPNATWAHTELGRVRAVLGEVDAGWREFAWWCLPLRLQTRAFEQPVWSGSSLKEQTILVWADQELGDTIQWLRYVPALKRIGARVVVECQVRLVPLVRTMAGIDAVVGQQAPLPAFDVHVPITLLPIISKECRTSPCQTPYFRADTKLVDVWRRRLTEVKRVSAGGRTVTIGICWAGHPEGINRAFRFASLNTFAPLGKLQGVRFISLQMGPRAAEVLCTPSALCVEHLQDETCSMADTAALMESLDLIITVDTMVAHLAGALGRTVWLMLPHVADWRWEQDPHRSSLYPTMRLFRQSRSGDWVDLFERVSRALDCWKASPDQEVNDALTSADTRNVQPLKVINVR
jgi:tetratricopeptide (TPR) repeat protein